MGRYPNCCICREPIKGEEPVVIKETGSFFDGKKCHNKCLQENTENLVELAKQKIKEKKQKTSFAQKQEIANKIIEEEKQKKKKGNKLPEEEIKGLDDVYQYFKKLLGYNHPLSKTQAHCIQNLREGKIIKRGEEVIVNPEGYPYPIILMTLKAKQADILNAWKTKTFKTENDKMRYAIAILRENINDIYERWRRAETQRVQLDRMAAVEAQEEETPKAKYVSQPEQYADDPLFEEFW